jgi:hypothetical protein
MFSHETVLSILDELNYLRESLKKIKKLCVKENQSDTLNSIESIAINALSRRYK